jgi:hypothetical protein
MHTGIGTDTLNSGRGELHVETTKKVNLSTLSTSTIHTDEETHVTGNDNVKRGSEAIQGKFSIEQESGTIQSDMTPTKMALAKAVPPEELVNSALNGLTWKIGVVYRGNNRYPTKVVVASTYTDVAIKTHKDVYDFLVDVLFNYGRS